MRSRISYPPSESVRKYQRLNGPGESLFYGCTSGHDEGSFEIGCLYECLAQPGQRYIVGEWVASQHMQVSHVGYSSSTYAERVLRPVQSWATIEDSNPVISDIRQWQSDAFVRKIAAGEEDQYRMSIAIAKFWMQPISVPSDESDFVSGVVYPSVAAELGIDNIALKPSEVDRALRLERTWFVEVESVDAILLNPSLGSAETPIGRMNVRILDISRECRADGTILWLHPSTLFFPASWTGSQTTRS